MLFSVIVPLYNKEDTIQRAVNSALRQKRLPAEIFIIDDGSTDESVRRVNDIKSPLVRVISQANHGPGFARNVGISLSRARYCAFLDADDEWHPNHLENAASAFSDKAECSAYVCGYNSGSYREARPNLIRQLNMSGCVTPPLDASGPTLKGLVDAMHSSCVVVKAETFRCLGGFFEKDQCVYGEDSFLWLRILLTRHVYWNPSEDVYFHVEDSELGYAVRKRKKARPASLYPEQIYEGMSLAEKRAAKRAIDYFALLDLYQLVDSGSQDAVYELERVHPSLRLRRLKIPLWRLKQKLLGLLGSKIRSSD